MAGSINMAVQSVASLFDKGGAAPSSGKAESKAVTSDGAKADINALSVESVQKLDAEKVKTMAPTNESTNAMVKEDFKEVASALNALAKASDRNLNFSVNDKTGDIVIQVQNGETGENIRTIPTEGVIQMKESIVDMAGLLFDASS
ncbi:MAG: flagellar protein FlaG [Candidatus Lindowbacteria bacterium]|nr:flagellar protein FlaG [Candidatus Lindowbacteria bacterium]